MAAFDFPNTPAVGDSANGYVWDGEKWANGATGTLVYVSDSAPAAPVGALWWESDTGILFFKYNDGNSTQWVAISDGGAGAVRFDMPQVLTEPQKVQARQNVYAAPLDALAYSGMQVNGSMEVSQENGTGVSVSVSGAVVFDGWRMARAGAAVFGCNQQADPVTFPGFQYYLLGLVFTAQPSLGAGDQAFVWQPVEGYRMSRLAWGTAKAQPLTVGFWTDHHRAGIYSVALCNYDASLSYATTYTQAVGDVPQYNVVTISGPTTGVWKADNLTGFQLRFAMAAGSTFTAPAANAWSSGNYIAAPGQVNAVASTSDVFRLAGVVVLPGVEAPSAARSPLIMRPYDQELVTCRRYWQPADGGIAGVASAGGHSWGVRVPLTPPMRASPAITLVYTQVNMAGAATDLISPIGFRAYNTSIAAGPFDFNINSTKCDARL